MRYKGGKITNHRYAGNGTDVYYLTINEYPSKIVICINF